MFDLFHQIWPTAMCKNPGFSSQSERFQQDTTYPAYPLDGID